jgi:hypothetical protein
LPAVQDSVVVPALATGETLYARLYTKLGGQWFSHYQDLSFTAEANPVAFTYPTAGEQDVDTTQPFAWSTSPHAQAYYVTIGSTPGGSDLWYSGTIPSTRSQIYVPALPTGETLYARIYTKIAGMWGNYQQESFTAEQNAVSFTNPTQGEQSVQTPAAFTWSTTGAAEGFYVTIGTNQGAQDVWYSTRLPASQTSVSVPALPAGETLYARIYTELGGSWRNYQDITFTTPAQASAASADRTRPQHPLPQAIARQSRRQRPPAWLTRLNHATPPAGWKTQPHHTPHLRLTIQPRRPTHPHRRH